jgi:GntR family transcriptional regulator, transcriptional repressor for pyruvate dehydrogenase complex
MKSVRFEPLFVGRVSMHIERKVKEAILNERIKPGERLPSERELAVQFKVSLGSVREALRALQVQGLIEKRRGRLGGVFVAEISGQAAKTALENLMALKKVSIRHIYEARKMLEPQIVRMALASIATPSVIKRLEENISSIEKRVKQIGTRLTRKEYIALDKRIVEFHEIIVEATGNPILIFIFDYVADQIAEIDEIRGNLGIGFINTMLSEHKMLLNYIKRRDAERCEEEMASHLRKLDQYLAEVEKEFLKRNLGLG